MRRVLIVGGGTGGTMLANSLGRGFEVTVIADSLAHMFAPALLYVAFRNAQPTIVRNERRLLASHVRLIDRRATAIDLHARIVTTDDGERYAYDNLVVATGIGTDPAQIPGLGAVNREFGDYHSTIAQAQRVWRHLDGFTGGTIALGQSSPICKCPPSPIEGVLLAEELVRARGYRAATRIVFFTPFPRAYPAEAIDAVVAPILHARGIELMTFFDVAEIDSEKRVIRSIEGDDISYDLPIVIPPFVGASIAYEPAGVVDASRFVKCDKATLTIEGFEDAFAIGDATNVPTAKSGVTAHLQSKVVAARLRGRDVRFDGRTNCPMDLAGGRALFVVGSYAAPVVHQNPSRIKAFMKMSMAKIYWLSLRTLLDPFFDLYFRLTRPAPPGVQPGP